VKASSSYGSLQSAELTVIPKKKIRRRSRRSRRRRRRKKRSSSRRRRTPAMAVFMEPFSLHDAVANEEMIFQCGCFPFLGRTRKKTETTKTDCNITHEFVDH